MSQLKSRGRRIAVLKGIPLRCRIATILVGVAIAVLVGPVPPASAHATLLFTTPAVDGAVPQSPTDIQLVFDQRVTPSESALELTGDAGQSVRLGDVTSGDNGHTVTAEVLSTLPVGEYVVHWQVAAADGDVMLGEYRFAVGSTSGLTVGGGTVQTKGLAATTMLRWLLFLGLALSLGGAVGSRLATRAAPAQAPAGPRPWLVAGTLLGLTAALGLALVYFGDGSMARGFPRTSAADFLSTTPGRVAAVEILTFATASVLFVVGHRTVGGLVLFLVPGAEGLRAHPQAASTGLGAVVTGVHLVAAAVWVGALLHVVRVGVAWRRQRVSAAGVVGAYARLAAWLFAVVVVTGSTAGLLLIPTDVLVPTLLQTGYGRWLLIKLGVVGVVAVLALWARHHLRRAPKLPQPAVVARYEVAGLVVVLGLSGLLTALAPPVRADAPLPFPPPPNGPVVAVGSLAGSIGTGVTASAGQLVVRLSTPDVDPAQNAVDTQSHELVGNVSRPRAKPMTLRFRACGPGCFVAPVDWTRGLATVTLRASAEGWTGGTTALTVAWPARAAPEILLRAVRTMRRVKTFTLHEQVTSDTSQGLGQPTRLGLSGRKFLASEPYGSGLAPTVVVLRQSGRETTIALAYPGEGTYVRLTIDADNQILRETLSAPNHLVTRTFVYPEADDGHHHQH